MKQITISKFNNNSRLALFAIALFLAPLARSQSYTVTVLPDPALGALAVNNHGQVAGFGEFAAGIQHAFVWSAAVGLHDLGALPGGGNSYAQGINDSGQIVGWSVGSVETRAFLWTSSGGMQDLGTLGGPSASAYGINDSGQIVGNAALADGVSQHAFLWTSAGGMKDLGTLGGNSSYAQSISNTGEVTGFSYLADNVTSHAFLWTQTGGMQDLGLSGEYVTALGINDAGTIVGLYARTNSGNQYGFVRLPNGKVFNVGTLGGTETVAFSINQTNQIVGYSTLATTDGNRGFLWTPAKGLQDLTSLVPAGNGVMAVGYAINRTGQIAVTGSLGPENFFAALLTPSQK
jgi:probable HAF family extracellular repeat protein